IFFPENVADGLNHLHHNPESKIIAGGTDLIVLMKDRLIQPSSLISFSKIPNMSQIRQSDDGWEIGAMTPLWQLERSVEIAREYTALIQAISKLAAPPIRNQATLGGNLCLDVKCIYYNQSQIMPRALEKCLKAGGDICHVAPGGKKCFGAMRAETVGPLMIYGSQITVCSEKKSRKLHVSRLFTGNGLFPHALEREEVITTIHLPRVAVGFGAAYIRLARRKAIDFSHLNLTAGIQLYDVDRVQKVELVVGALAPKPIEIRESLSVLVGKKPSPELWSGAAREATREVRKISGSPRLTPYLQKAMPIYIERVLEQATQQALMDRR
ncbi:MAG: FAD binding domain-containing protein, partial [Deltaproteobacteria bacterium]|nr:FAD binding domain-containing protein [Deltaproteobacteria bacterium]